MAAVVTGAARGIGRGITLALAAAGHDVVVAWSSSEQEAKQLVVDVEALGRSAVSVQGDVRTAATSTALAEAAASLGGLSAWVNNAGVSCIATVADTTPADLQRMLEVNVVGTLHGIQAAVAAMRTRGGGRIVNIASDLGVTGARLLGAYAATKFAVLGLTQSAALELAGDGITVNAVCPGTVASDMVEAEWQAESALTGAPVETVRASYLSAIPSGRFCTPADVGDLVAFLVGPGAAHLTGQSLCVNGGSVLH